jgi:hypothetical protein
MSTVELASSHSVRITSTWRLAATWIGAAIIAIPLAVLLHELGHFLAYWAFGFQGLALHYSSSTHAVETRFWQLIYSGNVERAAALLPLWKVGVATTAGILFTYLVTIGCCVFRSEEKSAPSGDCARASFAPVRFLSGLPTIVAALSGRRVSAGTDEAHLAALTGIPVLLLNVTGLLVLVLAWIWLLRSIPKDHKWISLVSVVSGLALGIFLYFSVLGPRLLP